MASSSSSSSSSSLTDRTVLVRARSVVNGKNLGDIRWHFEGPHVGGPLRPNGVTFIDDNCFILSFCDSSSSTKVLKKEKHLVPIDDGGIEMIVELCPLDIAAKYCDKKSSWKMETEPIRNEIDDFSPSSSSKAINIVPKECHSNVEPTFTDSSPTDYTADDKMDNNAAVVSMKGLDPDSISSSSADIHGCRRHSSASSEEEDQVLAKRIKLERLDRELNQEQELNSEQTFTGNIADFGALSSDPEVRRRMIQVLDVPASFHIFLDLYLESAKNGGGELEQYSYDEENHVYVATFVEQAVAERFVEKGSITVDGHTLQISRLSEMAPSSGRVKEEAMETKENIEHAPTYMIEVKGLKPKHTEEVLKLYFENKKRSGGGKIEDVRIFPDEERAVITFQDAEAVRRVIERKEHSVLGLPAQCVSLDGTVGHGPVHAIEVCGLDENISEEMLTLFFENRKRSGGGTIEDLYWSAEDHRAVITFVLPEVVERILQNHRSTPLVLDGCRLTVSVMKSAFFPACSAAAVESDTILVHNIPGDSSREDFIRYLQRGAVSSVKKLRYSLHPGTALAHFEADYDHDRLRDLVGSRPFRGAMLSIEQVPVPHSIQVFNIGNISPDHLQLYFESSRSGGDEVVESEINTDGNFAILKFANRKVISSVLSKEHVLDGRTLSLSIYYEGFGAMPPDVNDEAPVWWLPPDVSFNCGLQKLSFILSSAKLKTKIEMELESLHCKVEWPSLTRDEDPKVPCNLTLVCTLNHSSRNVVQLAKTWADTCSDKLNEEFNNILFEEIGLLQELWRTVCDEMKTLDRGIFDDDNVKIDVDDDLCIIRIIGVKKSCKKFTDSLKKLVSKAEDVLEKEKRKITEQLPKLKCHQFEILKLIGFLESSPEAGVDVTVKGMDVIFFGQSSDIVARKLKMYETLNTIVSETIDLPGFVLESLKLAPFRNHISTCLLEKKSISSWDLGAKGLTVYGLNQAEVDKTALILKSEVIQRQLELDAPEASALLLPGWDSLKSSLKNEFGVVCLKENGSGLSITSTSSRIDAILERISNFIKENAIREDFLMTKRGTAAILTLYLKNDLQTICKDFLSCCVKIKEDLDINHAGFTISGTVFGLQSALNKVVELSKKVIEKEKVLDRPGLSNYIRSNRGQKQIDVISSRHRVFIEDWEEANKSNSVSAELRKRVGANASRQPQVLGEIRLKHLLSVKVVQGDITEYKVDAIVNAANGQLDHHGGVAKVIVDKGGSEIQVECKAYIRTKGPLLPGHLFVSKPGSLPCKYIIHAVGPIWENGLKNEENVLFGTIYNVLSEAEKLKIQSIAMPAISTGVYGFPMRKAAKITLEAVAEFAEKESLLSLREVHIIDNNRIATKEFKDMLANHGTLPRRPRKGSDKPIVIDDDNGDSDDSDFIFDWSLRPGTSRDRTPPSYLYQTSPLSLPANNSPSKIYSGFGTPSSSSGASSSTATASKSSSVSSNVLTTLQGLRVTLTKGSIVGQMVDVIVNTTAQNLALNNGAVSSLILQTAGPSIQAECKQKAPNGLSLGQVVVTSGYSLPCQFVYHGYCLNWDNKNGPCEQSIRGLLKAILLQAHTDSMASIAIPAIGTGNLKVPPDVVARIMYEEVEEFSQTQLGTTLTDIRFVVYDKDLPTVAAFEKELHFPSRGAKAKGKKAQDRVLAKTNPGETSKSAGTFGGWSISIKDLKLEVIEGDITQAKTEAIVNSASESLNLKQGAVSAAILRAGGQEIQDECSKIGKMSDGMAVTKAGKLPSKFIFHLKAHTSERGWRKGIENCLIEAERRKIRSITFPLLGTGNIGAPVKMMASVMLDSVINFSTKSNLQHLQLIQIAIFQSHMVEEFAQAIDKKAQDLQTSGYFDQLKVYIKSLFGFSDSASTVRGFDVQEIPQQTVRKFDGIIRLIIYGLTENSIENAIGELDDLCSDVIQDKVIENDGIAKLSPEQIERIKNLQNEFAIQITVEQGHRLNRIRLQGEGQTIVSVVDKIYNVFHEVEQKEREEYHAEIVAKQAQWMYQCDDSFDPYPKPINLIIEKAYQDRSPFAEWEEKDGRYRLDFHRMEETKNQDTANTVKVKRMVAESKIPKNWDVMNANELCKCVLLPPSSQEYQDVVSNVHATAGGTVRQIVSVQRIQNPSLYQQYLIRKDTMQTIAQCERILWHGTSADTLESINHHGFNRSYCGKNAVMYGRGVYFALNFNYSGSNTYAVPDANGNKHVYLSRVLTGEFVVGNQSYFVAPLKSGSTVARYDCVVDNPAAPSIFVIFSDTQAYPEYLIVFK